MTLQDFAASTTRQLDDSYYSLLSSAPSIQDSLSRLCDTARQSQAFLEQFTNDSVPALSNEISAQISTLKDNFDNLQSNRIAGLENRMRDARKRVEGLSERVERVRERVEEWESREKEAKRRGRRNLGILWGVLGTLLGLFVVIVLYRGWNAEKHNLDDVAKREAWKASQQLEAILSNANLTELDDLLKEGKITAAKTPRPESIKRKVPQQTSPRKEVEEIFRILDEL
jgi:hypothetical protein